MSGSDVPAPREFVPATRPIPAELDFEIWKKAAGLVVLKVTGSTSTPHSPSSLPSPPQG